MEIERENEITLVVEQRAVEIERETEIVEQTEETAETVVERTNYRGIKAMPFIMGNEICERLGTLGLLFGLQLYLTQVFNMKHIGATTLVSVFDGISNLATLPGAYLSDTYFGRFKTLAFGSVTSFLGMLVIALTALIKKLHPPHCGKEDTHCVGPTPWQLAFLLLGFGLLITGSGAIRPCNLAFGVDQFNPNTESGKRSTDSFINWYFITSTFAQMVSMTFILYVQTNVNWGIGLSIPAILMLISCILFMCGTKIYVVMRPEGNLLRSVAQVVTVAMKKRRLQPPQQPWLSLFSYLPARSINSKLPYTNQFRFLDKAAIITAGDEINPDGSAADPWKLCSMQQVEEVKCMLRVIPIWTTIFVYHIGQSQKYLVFQAVQSNRHLGSFQIPPPSYSVFSMLAITLWLPVYDRLLVPFLRRRRTGISTLQRIGVGVFLTIIESLVSAFVEQRRRSLVGQGEAAKSYRGAMSSMSAMWLAPQLLVAGLAEAFAGVGLTEFFNMQFPENMRSFGGAFFFLGWALANFLSTLLMTVVRRTTHNWLPEDLNHGRLDFFYFLVAGLCVFNFFYFLVCANWYRYRGAGTLLPSS